jgi:hypothetical protein|tara:strand:+ start:127 stop:504 length:378 start_codon:yes stop_codon:yes gene_type:complete
LPLDKESLSNISSYLFDEFLKHTDKYKTVSYFRRSPGGSLLMFKIMHSYFLNQDLHVEELIRKVPISIASRLSLFTLIDNAVKKGILIKEGSGGGDKRKKSIIPSDIFLKEYKDWLHNYISQIQS